VAADRYVVVGLAHARASWSGDVARWATAGAVPVEYLPCVSVEELRARLASGRPISAVLLDGGVPGIDRDVVDVASRARSGAAVLVVDDGLVARDWVALGAAAVLPTPLDAAALRDALGSHAVAIPRREATGWTPPASVPGWHGPLVAVTGGGGVGASVVAAALAQGLGDDPRAAGSVVLADLALDAQQAVLHDANDVVPGLPELVEAHRIGTPAVDDVRELTFSVTGRGYRLLLGLRRHRDWAALRPRAVAAGLDGLRRAFRIVVADVDPDVEDVEDRNTLARTALSAASVVVVVGRPGPTGVHRTLGVRHGLLDHGVEPDRIVTVVNRAPRAARARAEITRALADLSSGEPTASPIFLPDRHKLDDLVADGHRLPSTLSTPLTDVVTVFLASVAEPTRTTEPAPLR
jgi:MinD-like ATPase involved in chromosome partitioning or flagellar assembly